MKKIWIIFVLLLLLCLSGCKEDESAKLEVTGGVQNPSDASDSDLLCALGTQEEVISLSHPAAIYTSKGIYSSGGAAFRFSDSQTGETMLVCFDPTCDHKFRKDAGGNWTTECLALRIGWADAGSRITGDLVYDVSNTTDSLEIVITSLQDGTRKKFLTADEMGMTRDTTYYRQDQLFLSYDITRDYEKEKETGERQELENWKAGLCMVSLTDGTVRKLVLKEKEGVDSVIQNLFCDGENLYYGYFYQDGDHVTSEAWKYNLKTETETMIAKVPYMTDFYFRKGYYAYSYKSEEEDAAKLYIQRSDEEPELVAECDGVYSWYSCWAADEELFYAQHSSDDDKPKELYCYDLQKKENTLLGTTEEPLKIKAVFPNVVYFIIGQGEALTYASMSMEDFRAGNFDKIQELCEVNVDNEKYYEK